jgi:hypothetical protein
VNGYDGKLSSSFPTRKDFVRRANGGNNGKSHVVKLPYASAIAWSTCHGYKPGPRYAMHQAGTNRTASRRQVSASPMERGRVDDESSGNDDKDKINKIFLGHVHVHVIFLDNGLTKPPAFCINDACIPPVVQPYYRVFSMKHQKKNGVNKRLGKNYMLKGKF